MPRKAHDVKPGDLVGYSNYTAECIARVVSVNCATACIAEVEIHETERRTGQLLTVPKSSLWPVPTPDKIADQKVELRAAHLARKLRDQSHHKDYEPQIKEISLQGLRHDTLYEQW